MVGGAESETTVKRNRAALDSLAFRPRILRDVAQVDATGLLLGQRLRIPVFAAPIGSLSLFTPQGPVAAARAAVSFGTTAFVSTVADVGLEEVAAAAGIDRLQQTGLRSLSEQMQTYQAALDWQGLDRLARRAGLPLIVKGVLTAEDARLAVDHGAAAVYVSNHGGRQLDHARGTMDALPEIAAAVAGRAEILIDGGFVRGTDVIKALARGATCVGIGKLQAWALAAGGEQGLYRAFELLELEIETSLRLLGVARLDRIEPEQVEPCRSVTLPSVTSALPWPDGQWQPTGS